MINNCHQIALSILAIILLVTLTTVDLRGQYSSAYAQKHYPAYTNPCPPCSTGPCHQHKKGLWNLAGFGGQPYRETSKRTKLIDRNHRPGIMRQSAFWPAPFSSWHQHGLKGCLNGSTCEPRLRDSLDHLATFKLVPFNVRKDNGYYGHDCDAYGYLGESNSYQNTNWTAPTYLSRRYPPKPQTRQK